MHLSTYTPFSLPLLTLFPAWGFLPTISKKSNEGWWRLSLGSTQLYISPHCKPLSLSSWTGGTMAASYQQYGRWKNKDQWFSSVKTSISQMICLFLRIAHPLAYPHGSSSARVRFKFRFSAMQREEWFQVHDARIGTRGGGEHRDTQNTEIHRTQTAQWIYWTHFISEYYSVIATSRQCCPVHRASSLCTDTLFNASQKSPKQIQHQGDYLLIKNMTLDKAQSGTF